MESGPLVTLIPQCFLNNISWLNLNANYKDGDYSNIGIIWQTKAAVKTNNKLRQLPLRITREKITPLLGLDWMQLLGIAWNLSNENIEIHNK